MKIKHVILLSIICLLLVLVQNTFVFVIFGSLLAPSLLLGFIFSLFLANKTESALISTLIGGLITDLLGFGYIGFFPFLVSAFILAAMYVRKNFFKGLYVQVISFYIFNLLFQFLYYSPNFTFKETSLVQALLTTVCSLFSYFILKKLGMTDEKSIYRRA